MSPLRTLLGQTAIYGVSSIVGRVVNFFILTPFYTRIFERGEYGVVTELYAYVAFLLVFLTYGMETAFFRFSSAQSDPEKRRSIFSTGFYSLFITSTLFIAAVYLFRVDIIGALGYESMPELILLFAWIVAIDALVTLPFARLRLENKALYFAMVNLISIGVNIGLNLFFYLYCPAAYANGNEFVALFYNAEFGIGYVLVANLAGSLVKLLLLLPALRGLGKGFDWSLYRKLIPYALPLLFLGLAGIINETFDRAVFRRISGLPEAEATAQLGIYGACYKVAMLLSIGIQAYRFAAEPFIFSLKKGEQRDKIQADIMKYYFIVALFISLALICFEDVALLLIGEEFREGANVIPILLGAYVCYGVIFNLSFWYKLNDKTIYGALIAAFGAIVTIALNIILVPKIGYYGSAWATLAAYLVMTLFSYGLMKKHHPVPYDLKEISVYVVLVVALIISVKMLEPAGWMKYLAGGLAVAIFASVTLIKEKKYLSVKIHGKD